MGNRHVHGVSGCIVVACVLAACASTGSGAEIVQSHIVSPDVTAPFSTGDATATTVASSAPAATDVTQPGSGTSVPADTAAPGTVAPNTAAPNTVPPDTAVPGTVTPATDGPTTNLTATITIHPGSGKRKRAYDDTVKAELDDIVSFWANEFPFVFGSPYKVPTKGVFPGYPGRTDIPDCGGMPVDYDNVLKGNAFYCPESDFLAYDDDQLFPAVFRKLGAVPLGVILAHELGHSVQARAGVAADTPTIILEQQADCYAGSWAAHLQQENNAQMPFGEADVKNALLALLSFKDPLGADPTQPGAHGSGFDRVGAFEDGFSNGAKKCSTYIDKMPPVLELPVDQGFFVNNGNAPLDDPNNPVLPDPNNPNANSGIYGLLITDLPRFWQQQLSSQSVKFTPPKIAGYNASGPFPACDTKLDFAKSSSVYCPSTNTVDVNITVGKQFYNQFGDFAIGFVVGDGYSEAVQTALGSKLTGAKRALLDDCLTGVYTKDTIPSTSTQANQVTIQAGDLDEAVEAAIEVGDSTSAQNHLGTGFQKVASFRSGVLTGISACKTTG